MSPYSIYDYMVTIGGVPLPMFLASSNIHFFPLNTMTFHKNLSIMYGPPFAAEYVSLSILEAYGLDTFLLIFPQPYGLET